MKVLLLSGTLSRDGGGVPVVIRDHARALVETGEISIRVMGASKRPLGAAECRDWAGLETTVFPVIGTPRYGFSPGLLNAVVKADVDVIHVHGLWQFYCLAAYAAHLRRGVPIIVSPHGMAEPWIRRRTPRFKAMVSRLYQSRFLASAFAVHVLTEAEGTDITDMIGRRPRLALIPNFVDPAPSDPSAPSWWQPEYEGRDVFLFFGRLHEKKGCLELCEAWDALCSRKPAFAAKSLLVFCGPYGGLDGFEERIATLAARHGNALAVGPQFGDEKNRSLGKATFLCLPSKSEGLPMSILEGWAAGVPAIMTPACNLAIGFERGAALMTTPTAEGIGASLERAGAMGIAERARMVRAARDLAGDVFARENAIRDLATLYREAIQGNMR